MFQDGVAAGGDGLRLLALEGAVPVEGGVPLVVGGKIVGAIGASGGTSEQDGVVAERCGRGAEVGAGLQAARGPAEAGPHVYPAISNVSDAQKLSQSAFEPAGAGTMCTAFTSHAPGSSMANAARPSRSDRTLSLWYGVRWLYGHDQRAGERAPADT